MLNKRTQKPGLGAAYLTEGAVGLTLRRLTIPMLFGIVTIMIFNLTDTWFASLLGTAELAAMSFTFPVVALIGSVTMGLGVGVTAVLSGLIGAGKRQQVREMTRDSLIMAVAVVMVFAGLGLATIDPIFTLLGADAETLPLVREYMTIWYLGMVFLVVPMVGNGAIRATGDTRTPAILMMAAGLLNVALDPIFMFGFWFVPAMGLKGAAIASVLSRAVTLVLSLAVLIRGNMVATSLPRWRSIWAHWRAVLAIGAPAAATNMLVPASAALVTAIISTHGSAAVAALGAGTRVQMIALIVPMALSSALMPFIGQNWGAGASGRVREAIAKSQKFVFLWSAGVSVLIALLAGPIARLFSVTGDVLGPLELYLQLVVFGIAFEAVATIAGSVFNAVQKPLRSTALTGLRVLCLLIPAVYIGSTLNGVRGAFIGIVIANVVAGIAAYVWLRPIGAAPAPAADAMVPSAVQTPAS